MTGCIRPALPADAAAILALVRDHAAFERSVAALTHGELAALLSADRPPTHLLVAEGGTALVGYAAVTFDFSLWRARRYAHLDGLFVAREERGRGIGRKLLAAVKDFAQRTEGVDRLEWQTPAWNGEAIRFYLRAGATGVPKQRFAMPLR